MGDSASTSKQKIQRTSRPKVRSGCITCKKRRVKCDETKPECLRCQNFGCSCDGYEFTTSKHDSRIMPRRVLVPKLQGSVLKQSMKSSNAKRVDQLFRVTQECQAYQTLLVKNGSQTILSDDPLATIPYNEPYQNDAIASPANSLVIYSPSVTIFESDREIQYFRFYCETTAHQLSGSFSDGIWNHAFLQACHEEPFVRRAIIAIAALSKAMEVSHVDVNGAKSLPDINDISSKNPHHVYALQQYGKSVKQMRDAMENRNENIRMALISCLLTICFESFHGHHENAIAQIAAGLSIMQDWLKKQYPIAHISGLNSPNRYIMDDRLFHSFIRLNISSMHFFDRRSGEFHRVKSLEGFEAVQNMPESFSRLEEARVYFSVVMTRIMHFTKWIESKTMMHHHRKQARLGETALETNYPNRHINIVLAPRLIEVEGYLGELDRWNTAFQPILDRSMTSEFQMELLPVSFLKLQQKLIFMLLSGLKCFEECLFDQYLPEFTEIVATAETLLCHPHPAHSAGKAVFVFDPNTILPLLLVTIKCRNWAVRRKAIELLQKHPRREGTWDSSLSAAMGLWHMKLEERGLQPGEFIPEKNRVRIASVKQDFDGRTAVLSASQEVDGKMVIHETTVNW